MKEDKDDLKYWLCFSQFNNIGPARWQRLLKYFPDMESAFKAGHNELVQAGLEPEIAQELISARARIEPEALLDRLDKEKVGAMTIKDTAYPAQLKEIHGAPPLLYYKGDINITNELCLAVVGARKYTPYGKQAAEHLVYVLAANRLVIVSGLALGIDAIAHETALAVNGLTVAVLGAGLDRQNIYPSANRYLADKILSSGGALVSEFPLGMAPLKHNFPQRNRVISGLSVGTLVVEANEGSGSLITAKHALDQNREVFAVPGSIFSPASAGTLALVKQGATAVTEAADILSALDLSLLTDYTHKKNTEPQSESEGRILPFLSREARHIDEIVRRSGLSSAAVASELVLMEMRGTVKNLGGMMYVLAR